jgi:hypothetical protein
MALPSDLTPAVQGPTVLPYPMGFARVMNDVARSGLLTAAELGVYTLIQSYAGGSGECWQSHAALGECVQLDPRSIQRYVKRLVAKGFLSERSRGLGLTHALAPSDDWRQLTPPAGSVVPPYDKSDTPPTTDLSYPPVKTVVPPTTNLSYLKEPGEEPAKEPGKEPGRTGTGDAAGAAARPAPSGPAAAEMPKSTPKREPSPTRARIAPDFKPSSALRSWAAGHGFDSSALANELTLFVEYHTIAKTTSADFNRNLLSWLRKEIEYAGRDGRPLGEHDASRGAPERDYYATRDPISTERLRAGRPGRPGQSIGNVTGWPGAGWSQEAEDAANDPSWELP